MAYLTYLFFVILMFIAMIGLIFYYYNGKRKDKVEQAKYAMLDDEDD